ncbi:MAG: hypothetical protein K0R14_179 [Burkholderiales bacterium]|nr:hypothetical protein [Burkholderiales bacterium]
MNKAFLQLEGSAQLNLLDIGRSILQIDQFNIEKDFWMCWSLEKLFAYKGNKFVFKGGTTLSKVYEVIDRYSEDIDITIDYTQFIDHIDFKNISNSKLKNLSETLKSKLATYLAEIIVPYLNAQYKAEFAKMSGGFSLKNGEVILFNYTSILEESKYTLNYIKLEFGARNTIEPSEIKYINTYIDTVNGTASKIRVSVLSPERTFWEKVTLIHVECHRGRLANTPDRLSRHWYDLYQLANSNYRDSAINGKAVLENVLMIKNAFYKNSYSNYDKCISGNFHLVPFTDEIAGLKSDYNLMIENDYFFKMPPSFDEIITGLSILEKQINSVYS